MLDRLEKLLEWGGTRRKVALLSVSGLALLMSMLGLEPLPFEVSWIAIVLCGVPIVLEAVLGLATAWDIKADVLVSVALVASVIIGEDFAAAEIAFIMQLGELLEELTVARARKGIERLVRLTPATARKVEGAREEVIPAEDVCIGDVLRVLPGETIPADGIILSGHTSVNQSVMTGEPLPIDKETGDEVSSGTVNQFGTFDMKAARTGKDSSIQRMVRLVQSADAGKAKIVRLADRWATWIVAIALVSAGGAWMATGELIRAVTILVVFCAGNSHSGHGRHRERHQAWFSGAGRGCPGTPVLRVPPHFRQDGHAYLRCSARGGRAQFPAGAPGTGNLQICRLCGTAF